MNGYIKLHRSIMDWRWYDDPNTFRMFVHLLLKANHAAKDWRTIKVERGQVVTSRSRLARELNLTEQNVRTALDHLVLTKEVTMESTKTYTLINVINWDKYQCASTEGNQLSNQLSNQELTNDQPTGNQQVTTNKNDKKNKKDKNDKKDTYIDHFPDFWTAYPRKISKAEAKREWDKLKPDAATFDKIMKCLEWYKRHEWSEKEKQYIPHARTWLHQKRWADEPETEPDKPAPTVDDNLQHIEELMKGLGLNGDA